MAGWIDELRVLFLNLLRVGQGVIGLGLEEVGEEVFP